MGAADPTQSNPIHSGGLQPNDSRRWTCVNPLRSMAPIEPGRERRSAIRDNRLWGTVPTRPGHSPRRRLVFQLKHFTLLPATFTESTETVSNTPNHTEPFHIRHMLTQIDSWRLKGWGRIVLIFGLVLFFSSLFVPHPALGYAATGALLVAVSVYGLGLVLMRIRHEAWSCSKPGTHQ